MADIHTLPSGRMVALGRRGVKRDVRTLRLASYVLAAALPAAPVRVVNSDKVGSWGMLLNDRLGDCTCAGVGHLAMLNAALVHQTATVTDQEVLDLYEKAAGYNPNYPSTDQGAFELDVLNYWRHAGFAGQTPIAYAAVDPHDQTMIQQAIDLFGAVYIGLALPRSAQAQDGAVWDVSAGADGQPGSWGGHAVIVLDYDTSLHELRCITWGSVQRMTEAFFLAYCDEAYSVLTDAWRQTTPDAALDFAALDADLAQIGRLQA